MALIPIVHGLCPNFILDLICILLPYVFSLDSSVISLTAPAPTAPAQPLRLLPVVSHTLFSVKHTAITVCPCACPAKGRGHPMIGPLCIKCPCYCGPSVGSHKPRIRVDTEVPPASPQGSVPWVLLQGGSPSGILGFDPPTSGTEVKSSNH